MKTPSNLCDLVLDDGSEPRVVATGTLTRNRLTTPVKYRKPKDDLARDVSGAFYESDDSSALSSSSSSAGSPLFPPDEGDLGGTPDATFSSDF